MTPSAWVQTLGALVWLVAACAPAPSPAGARPTIDASSIDSGVAEAPGDGADVARAWTVVGGVLRGRAPFEGCRGATARLVAAVSPLVHAPTRVQRAAAFACLSEASRVDAVPALLEIFADASFRPGAEGRDYLVYINWNVALQGLTRHVRAEHVPLLLATLDGCSDATGRVGLARLLFRVAETSDVDAIRARLEREIGEARIGLLAVLVRLGDQAARAEFATYLASTVDRGLCGMFGDAHGVAGPWLLPVLAPMLRSRTSCVRPVQLWDGDVGVFVAATAADFAVFEIVRITGHRFSFELDRLRFGRQERDEVERYVRTLLPGAGPR